MPTAVEIRALITKANISKYDARVGLAETLARVLATLECWALIAEDLGGTNTETDDRFWDCECEANYIHPKCVLHCPLCGAYATDQPDARVDEIRDVEV